MKEMFTTADNYFVKVGDSPVIDRRLLFACPIIIDILHHEKSGKEDQCSASNQKTPNTHKTHGIFIL